MELIYGEDESTKIVEDTIEVSISGMARSIHVRPVRLVESFEWMRDRGIITHLEWGYRTVRIRLRTSDRINTLVGGTQ